MWEGDYLISPQIDWDSTKTGNKEIRVFRIKEMHFDATQLEFPLFDARGRDDDPIIKLKEFVKVIEPIAEYSEDGNANLEHRQIPSKDPTVDDIPTDATAPQEPSPDEMDQQPLSIDDEKDNGEIVHTTTTDGMPLPWLRKILRRTDYKRPDSWDPDKWASLPREIKNFEYEKWRKEDPDAVERAWQEVISHHTIRGKNPPTRLHSYPTRGLETIYENDDTSYVVRADSSTHNLSYASYEHTRKIIEFCCSRDSRIGHLRPEQCQVHRLTIDNDLRFNKGLKEAYRAISNNATPTLVWASIPCTGGCPFVPTNITLAHKYNRPQTIEKIEGHKEDFKKIWRNFTKVANRHIVQGGKIAIEWPRNCSYWKRPEVRNWIKSKQLDFAHFHGCAVGLLHPNGKPMQKAWKVASNDDHLVRALDVLRCPHGKAKGIHEHIGASVTKRTEL